MASSEDRDRSPRRRQRSPGGDEEPGPAKARRRHDSPIKGSHRHAGHGNTDHDDDHRIQQRDEEDAGVHRATDNRSLQQHHGGGHRHAGHGNTDHDDDHRIQQRDEEDAGVHRAADSGRLQQLRGDDRSRSLSPNDSRSPSRDRQQDREEQPSQAVTRDRVAADGDGAARPDREQPSRDRSDRYAADDSSRGDRNRQQGGSRRDRWGYNAYQREEVADGGANGAAADAEMVRKGRGFANRRNEGDRHNSSRRSRSRSRDRSYRREDGRDSRYDGRDRQGDRYSDRDRDRGHDIRDRGTGYDDRDGRDSRDRDRADSRRNVRDGEGRGSRGDRDAAEGVPSSKAEYERIAAVPAAPEQQTAGPGGPAVEAAAVENGAATAAAGGSAAAAGPVAAGGAGDDKEAADTLKKKALSGRAGGAYIPPFRLARMMAEIDDKNSVAAQKLSWEALRKSLNGLINKVNAPNMKEILPELFQENLMRGRGLFCQAVMKAQLASPTFSALYAALVSVANTKFPELGELLCHRVIAQFKRAYKRNDKPITIAAAKFIAHLINQGVLHEVLALEILILLLENPSDDSVEMAVEFCKEVGAFLQDVAPTGLHSVFERFRAILHEGAIDRRCQYMIEGLFAVRKAGFEASGHPSVKTELDLVEDEDQITHEMSLDDKHDPQAILNVFREDPEYELHEQQYKTIVKEILGEESDAEGEGQEGSEEEDSEDEEAAAEQQQQDIQDATGTDVVNLRRTIYLTIMSSLDFEEAGHKLMKIQLAPGQESEIPIMIIECCSQEKTFVRYYALLGARFCLLRKEFQATFEDCFAKQYAIIHRLETNKLRNVAKLFAHLLSSDAISWGVLQCICLTEDDTTSSSRIFIKYLFQELSEYLGLVKLNERLAGPSLQEYFTGIFPTDTMANMRFSINFFTSIGLGGITDRQRELYKQMPRIMAERKAAEEAARAAAGGGSSSDGSSSSRTSSSSSGSSSSDTSSGSGSSSSSSSSSDSESEDSRDRRCRRRR